MNISAGEEGRLSTMSRMIVKTILSSCLLKCSELAFRVAQLEAAGRAANTMQGGASRLVPAALCQSHSMIYAASACFVFIDLSTELLASATCKLLQRNLIDLRSDLLLHFLDLRLSVLCISCGKVEN